jgi:hypothetical protein
MSKPKRTRPSRATSTPPAAPIPPLARSRPRVVDASRDANSSQDVPAFRVTKPNWGNNAFEWLRGKLELAWETVGQPFFGWIAARFGRRNRGISSRRVRRTGSLAGWSWDEQGARMAKRISRMVLVVGVSAAVLVVLAAGTVRLISAISGIHPSISLGLGSDSATSTPQGAISIRNTGGFDQGTPVGIPEYTFGMWASNQEPSGGEAITIYAKVTHYSTGVGGVPVVFSIGGNTTTISTDSNGLATWHINANGPAAYPVEIDGAVSVGGQNLTASTFYSII